DNGLIMAWRVGDGRPVLERLYLNGFGLDAPVRRDYDGRAVDWVHDQAVLVFGHALLSADDGDFVAELGGQGAVDHHLIDRQTLLLDQRPAEATPQSLVLTLDVEKLLGLLRQPEEAEEQAATARDR